MKTIAVATSLAAMLVAGPALAQETQTDPNQDTQTNQDQSTQSSENGEVAVLSNWTYDPLYAEGWSLDDFMWDGAVYGPDGEEEIGNVENVIFSNDGKAIALIAEVGGFWDIGDTHVSVPWDQVTVSPDGESVAIPVTEDSVGDYGIFDDTEWFSAQTFTEEQASEVAEVDDELEAGPNVFKATDFIGDYAYLEGQTPYGYVNDLLVRDGEIKAIVIDAASYYGRPGYYAYPYAADPNWDPYARGYTMPYGEAEIETLDTFDYERLAADPS